MGSEQPIFTNTDLQLQADGDTVLDRLERLVTLLENKLKPVPDDEFLTREELRDRLKLKTVYAVDHMVRAKKISPHSLGERTTRFYWPDIKRDLARFQRKAVNPDRDGRKKSDA